MAHHRRLIAVVDDDEPVCKGLSRQIVSMGMDVAVYYSGQAFLDSTSARPPDCVVLDLHMPGLGGVDVLRILAEGEPKFPVIVVTGRDEPASRALSIALGATAYLTKPLAHAELLRAIDEATRPSQVRLRPAPERDAPSED
jgi:FixJ family two-component response regulator